SRRPATPPRSFRGRVGNGELREIPATLRGLDIGLRVSGQQQAFGNELVAICPHLRDVIVERTIALLKRRPHVATPLALGRGLRKWNVSAVAIAELFGHISIAVPAGIGRKWYSDWRQADARDLVAVRVDRGHQRDILAVRPRRPGIRTSRRVDPVDRRG